MSFKRQLIEWVVARLSVVRGTELEENLRRLFRGVDTPTLEKPETSGRPAEERIWYPGDPEDIGGVISAWRLLVYASSAAAPQGWDSAGVPIGQTECDKNPIRAYDNAGTVLVDQPCNVTGVYNGDGGGYWIHPDSRIVSWRFAIAPLDASCTVGNAQDMWVDQARYDFGSLGLSAPRDFGGCIRSVASDEYLAFGHKPNSTVSQVYVANVPYLDPITYTLITMQAQAGEILVGVFSPSGDRYAWLQRNGAGDRLFVYEVDISGATSGTIAPTLVAQDNLVETLPYTQTPMGDGTTRVRIQFDVAQHLPVSIGYIGESLRITWAVLADAGDYVVDVDRSTMDESNATPGPERADCSNRLDPGRDLNWNPILQDCCPDGPCWIPTPQATGGVYVPMELGQDGDGFVEGAWAVYLTGLSDPDDYDYVPHTSTRDQKLSVEVRDPANSGNDLEQLAPLTIYSQTRPERAPRWSDSNIPHYITSNFGDPSSFPWETWCTPSACQGFVTDLHRQWCCGGAADNPDPDPGAILHTVTIWTVTRLSDEHGIIGHAGGATLGHIASMRIDDYYQPDGTALTKLTNIDKAAQVELPGFQAKTPCGTSPDFNLLSEFLSLHSEHERRIPGSGAELAEDMETLVSSVIGSFGPVQDRFALAVQFDRDTAQPKIAWSVRMDFPEDGGVDGVHNYVAGWDVSWIPAGGSFCGKDWRGMVETQCENS